MEETKAIYIDVKDFKGNRIICYEDRWFDHIANCKRNHNLEGLEEVVIDALQHPIYGIRYYDVDNPKKMSYYGAGGIARYVKVTVEFENSECIDIGYIITAYPVNEMKPGEIPELQK